MMAEKTQRYNTTNLLIFFKQIYTYRYLTSIVLITFRIVGGLSNFTKLRFLNIFCINLVAVGMHRFWAAPLCEIAIRGTSFDLCVCEICII